METAPVTAPDVDNAIPTAPNYLILNKSMDEAVLLGRKTIGADSWQAKPSLARAACVKTQAWADRGGSACGIFLDCYDLNKQMPFR